MPSKTVSHALPHDFSSKEHASKDSNVSLPTPKSSRQRSQKTLNVGGPNGPGSGGTRGMRSLKTAPKRGYQQLPDDEKTKPMSPNPLPPLSPRVLPAMQKQPRSLAAFYWVLPSGVRSQPLIEITWRHPQKSVVFFCFSIGERHTQNDQRLQEISPKAS